MRVCAVCHVCECGVCHGLECVVNDVYTEYVTYVRCMLLYTYAHTSVYVCLCMSVRVYESMIYVKTH